MRLIVGAGRPLLSRMPADKDFIPGLDACQSGRLSYFAISNFRLPSISIRIRSARTCPRPFIPSRIIPTNSAVCPNSGVKVVRGMTHDGLGYLSLADHRESPRSDRRYRQDSERHQHRCRRQLSARSAPRKPPSGMSNRFSKPAAVWSTASRSSSPARNTGRIASSNAACR